MITLTYIFHSGFVVETKSCVFVFDYWLDPAGVLDGVLTTSKPVYVLASHFHEDHFTRHIFDWRKLFPATRFTYLLSKDILRHKRAEASAADVWMTKGLEWIDEDVKVVATGSTDSGVSWVVEADGVRLFHAGDLNNWYARYLTDNYCGDTIMSEEFGEVNPLREEKRYLGELKDVAKVSNAFDIAMFPVDGRIGNGYTRGARQFLALFPVHLFVPMHFAASSFASAWRMQEFTNAAGVNFWRIQQEGEILTIEM